MSDAAFRLCVCSVYSQCLDPKGDPTHRRQAMSFLRACLASLLAMGSADGAKAMPSGAALFQSLSCVSDDTLAAAGAEEAGGGGAGGGKAGSAGATPEPQRVAAKTKTQLEAERELFTSLLQVRLVSGSLCCARGWLALYATALSRLLAMLKPRVVEREAVQL